ncbi:MAG: sialic acid synthase [Acidiferrobacteraceae bacterium]|nr:sialic acid synthase [Acidiferrobacteraceae bacterium]|tara:strand:- start:7240 stop:8745 length:1506 start_codon:yes stop_codon:yes gene_type:complete
MKKFDFNDLFILDLANNHQGDTDHAKNIIDSLASVARDAQVRAAIKFQFRQLETFIHPNHQKDSQAKHIPRFIETRLDIGAYADLLARVRDHGMVAMCTPFDEESVALIDKMGFDAIKVASCSVTDRPLLEAVVSVGLPVVISTGGAMISDIDRVVNLMSTNNIPFALEHCVSIYPTEMAQLQLNQITVLRERYPGIPVGWSTHEDPDDTITVQLAYAKGAVLYERHVGVETEKYKLNKYSSTPTQIKSWLLAHQCAVKRCGSLHRGPVQIAEAEALMSLKRGVFASRDIVAGSEIQRTDVFFAMPAENDGLFTSDWQDGYIADRNYTIGQSISSEVAKFDETEDQLIDKIMLQVRGMLHVARIELADSSKIEISHHYGLRRFREFGAVIIDVINREYCKKLIIQLPRQKHPYHYHKRKEETFQVLYGELEVEKNGSPKILQPGDIFLVEPEAWHKFSTQDGVIFEEISTTHFNDDSFYEDQAIARLPREKRKTLIQNWEF